MKHSYTLAGMTCNNCMATIKKRLLAHPGVTSVELNLEPQSAVIEMGTQVDTADLQTALGGGKYKIYDDVASKQDLV